MRQMMNSNMYLTFAAVMFEICAFRPDCRSGAVSAGDHEAALYALRGYIRTHHKDGSLSACLHLA